MIKDKIRIAFEPESVSVYFQYLYRHQPQMFPDSNGCDISQGKYLVIDIGGMFFLIQYQKIANDK